MSGMNVWKSFTNLKDTIGQVATDILDTTEEGEGIDSPGPVTYRDRLSSGGSDADRNMELQWYKSEVNRLQAAETEIQSLSMNYGDLLKQREVEVEELRKQNADLKARLCDSSKQSEENTSGGFGEDIPRLKEAIKGLQAELQRVQDLQEAQAASLQENHRKRTDALIARHRREVTSLQAKISGNHVQDAGSGKNTNGEASAVSSSKILELEQKLKKLQEREKDLARQVVDKDQSYGRLKDAYEHSVSEAKGLKEAVEQERASMMETQAQLEGMRGASEKAVQDVRTLSEERQQMAAELAELRNRLATESSGGEGALQSIVSFQGEEIQRLKAENEALRSHASDRHTTGVQNGEASIAKHLTTTDEAHEAEAQNGAGALSSAEREQLEQLEARIAAISLERDKAKKDLARLKQHLLDKETQESEKLEMDSARLGELEERARRAEEQARGLESALATARTEAEGARDLANRSTESSQGELARLRGELAGALAALEAKDAELANLQTALGQYYAESEAQERLYGELTASKEEVKRLTADVEGLRVQLASRSSEVSRSSERLAVVEGKLAESQGSVVRLQDEVTRLRRALEHSMTRMNRMSADSDYLVDRRIVVKLMVTFFERHHSKEVLDLMAKMLCFSEEDKKRVGLAQQSSRGGGVVRGVLNFPGRLVGGLIGAAAVPDSPAITVDENQTFADLWIDFLVRESEERERRDQERRDREKAEADILTEPRTLSPLSPVSRQRSLAESATTYPPRPSTPGHGSRSHSLDVSPSAAKRSGSVNPLSPASTPVRGGTHGADVDGNRHAETPRSSSAMASKDVDQGYASGGEFSPIPLHGVTPKATSMGGVFVPGRTPRP